MYSMIDIPIIEVAERCGLRMTHKGSGAEHRCYCPFCGQRGKPTASVNISRNLFYCHRCQESGNSISLYSKLIGVSHREAYRELLDRVA